MLALAPDYGFCDILFVAKTAQVNGNEPGASFDDAWKDVRADGDIQFTAEPTPTPPEIPEWLKDILEWLGDVLAPVMEALIFAWPVLRILLIVLLAVGVLTLLWIILSPYVQAWRGRKPAAEEIWQPEHHAARRLLDEADALANKGQFDEAAHLLLFRSIEDIESRRPDLLQPSSTSREIERFDSLPETARNMFAVIAGHVERGIFAASPIGEEGWKASRNAYGEFALKQSWKVAVKR